MDIRMGRIFLRLGEKNCKVIGTGALFSRGYADVNSQFNIINYHSGFFIRIHNCRFNADFKDSGSCWDVRDIGNYSDWNYFRDSNFKQVYKALLNKLDAVTPLYNVVLQVDTGYEKFKSDLEAFLKEDRLIIEGNQFDYFEVAKMWEEVEVPEALYFNHGQYFRTGDRHGITQIAEHLKNKPTSSRAILTTGSTETVMQSLKHGQNEFLPSLMSVQFSKDDAGTLFVHMHLRALEAGRFLKINVCEIYFYLEQLTESGIQINQVNITISAFRVQKRENFKCFIKADIDKLKPVELSATVTTGNIEEICRMLEEKRSATETIENCTGIRNLYDSMLASNKEERGYPYSKEIIKNIKDLLKKYESLEKIHRQRSIRGREEQTIEEEIKAGLGELIEKLKESEEEEGKSWLSRK